MAKHLESKLQIGCVTYMKLQYPKLLFYAIPNGGFRNKVESKIMKGEGVMSGVSDLFLSVPNKDYHGLYIEMKVGKNTITKNQAEFLHKAYESGYAIAVIKDFDNFKATVDSYLEDKFKGYFPDDLGLIIAEKLGGPKR